MNKNPNSATRDAKPDLPANDKPYAVLVDDNYHYMDESERNTHGCFATLDEAIAACKQIVDEYLMQVYKPGMPAADLYSSYTSFGDDPFIQGPGLDKPVFSAWTYAKAKAVELCGPDELMPSNW